MGGGGKGAAMASDAEQAPAAAASLARGGRTNFAGFLLRLAARFPFLVLAARLYGPGELGEFAYAVMVVEFVAALATMGLKRGLSAEMARGGRPETHALADGWVLGLGLALLGTAVLWLAPALGYAPVRIQMQESNGDHLTLTLRELP